MAHNLLLQSHCNHINYTYITAPFKLRSGCGGWYVYDYYWVVGLMDTKLREKVADGESENEKVKELVSGLKHFLTFFT